MEIEIRRTSPDEYRAACDTTCRSLLTSPPSDERWAEIKYTWDGPVSYSAWEGEDCVGHAAHLHIDTTVPGGARLATGAVARVGVLPTHARRGVGSQLMGALINDAAGQGWPLMSLRASEAVIYRRYGFGVAGDDASVEIDGGRAKPVRGIAPGPLRLLSPEEILAVTNNIYSRSLGRRPGLITRPDSWIDRMFRAARDHKENGVVAVYLDPAGRPDGYIYYTTAWGETLTDGGTGVVHDVVATSDAVELALWNHVFNVDLVTRWTSKSRPLDDLITEAIADRRAYRVTAITDEQWLRLIDVDRALSARTYTPVNGDGVVVAVVDPLIDTNNGRWYVGSEGVRRSDEAADLVADIDAVSAQYLGGMSWLTEAAVGRVRPGPGVDEQRFRRVLVEADQRFSVKPLPFCGTFF